jgi:type I restriction enzyme S subunit
MSNSQPSILNPQLPRGYKQTEVGVIPEDWEVKPLKVVSSMNGRIGWQGLKQEEFTENPDDPFLITGMNFKDGKIRWEEVYHIPTKRYNEAPAIQLRVDDLLMTKDGTIGKLLYVDAIPYPGKASLNSHLLVFRPIDNQYIQKFLFYQLASKAFVEFIELNKSGSTFFGLTQEATSNYKAILPPLPEQRAIAEALGDVDALLGAMTRLIAKKRDLKQAAMQQLLTGQTRLPGFGEAGTSQRTTIDQLPKDWTLSPLKSISTMNGRIGWQGLKQEEFTSVESDPFLITGMNFENGEIRWDEVYHIPENRYEEAKPIHLRGGDILITKDGTIGKLLFVESIPFPGKASLNSHLLVFRPLKNSYVPKFLFYHLSSKRFADYVDLYKSGTTFFGITQKAIGKYQVFLPSIEEQTAIAAVLSDMDAEIVALEDRLAKTRALKQGMMQELLTGRIRLV